MYRVRHGGVHTAMGLHMTLDIELATMKVVAFNEIVPEKKARAEGLEQLDMQKHYGLGYVLGYGEKDIEILCLRKKSNMEKFHTHIEN